MTEVKNVPKLRFPGFTEPWEQRMFSECYKITSGYAFKMSDYCDTGVGLINGESIQHGIINDDNLNHLPESFIQQYPEFLLKESDIVVGLNRPITNGNLKIARILSKYNNSLLYQRAGKIVYKTNCDKDFTYVLLSREILKYTLVEAVGSDQPFISTSKLDNWKMMIPSDTEEQSKIGKYFSCLDHLITLHQSKYETLLEYKKGLLQKMFPKVGETVPEIRFPGFDGEWEEIKVEDIGKYFNTSNLSYADLDTEGIYKCVLYGDLYTKFNEYIINVTLKTNKEVTKTKVNDLVFPTSTTVDSDSLIAPSCLLEDGIYVGGDMFGIRPNEDISGLFYSYMINGVSYVKHNFSNKAQGSTIIHIHYDDIKNIQVKKPSLEEQQKIGLFFKALDEKIELQKQKVDAIKKYKKGLLQQMFV